MNADRAPHPWFVALLVLCAACGSNPRTPPTGDDEDAGVDAAPEPETPGFTADEHAATGPAAWIEATVTGADVAATVRARDLGSLFGVSIHLGWDADALELAEPVDRAPATALLGGGDAIAIALARPGDVALGGSRASLEAGEIEQDGEATLAVVHLRATRAGSSRLALGRAVVAHADGTLAAIAVAGGELVTEEVTP